MVMDKIHAAGEQYRRFLLSRQFASEKTAGYMQNWVEKFLHFACDYRGESFEQVLTRFEAMLESGNAYEPWQLKQANNAVTLYHYHFRHHESGAKRIVRADNRDELMAKVREWMRIRHYAKKTEKSYLHWISRFLHYAEASGEGELTVLKFSGFISQFARGGHVSASTRNQVFNALLLLFRDILYVETANLPGSVRARQEGTRLPSVLSVNELQQIFTATDPESGVLRELKQARNLRWICWSRS